MIERELDTKQRIFLVASQLFALKGYEKVTIRNIADAIGVKSSSIYYHYASKDEILDACYDYYSAHRYEKRLTPEEYEPILRNGTKEEVIGVINYTFKDVMTMFFLAIIVFSRVFTDPKAKIIYQEEIDNALTYMNEFFELGIQIGRFRPFNVPVYAVIFLNTRLFTINSATLDPDQKKWRVTEVEVFNELIQTLPFNY